MNDPAFDHTFDEAVPGLLVRLSPLVRRVLAPNPGPMTFRGTCTYIVGHGEVAVIDPGPASPQHIDALVQGLSGERIAQIVVTHTHRDHSPGARLLKARTQAPIVGCAPYHPARMPHASETAAVAASNDVDHCPDRILSDHEILEGSGFRLQAVATPGHTMNHLAFALPEEKALFSGDHVMAWSTTVVSPPTGAMRPYMASLEKLRLREDGIYWPGHGGPVRDPQRFVRALLHHRRQREHAIRGRLAAGDCTINAIVDATYEKLDSHLRRAAAMSVLAHLEDLCERRLVAMDGIGLDARYTPA